MPRMAWAGYGKPTYVEGHKLKGIYQMKIQMKMRTDYGQPRYYPVCDKAKLFARLLDQKSLTSDNMRILQQLGIEAEMLSHKL